ncbi:MAG: TraR/DksA C4-type zinc finger protein [Candidatus Wildermuthbacteria bacterium]|nr:TraR/DksA C4-type zinc finger protein [Candidatus Wildermuthbacteria bacterium]
MEEFKKLLVEKKQNIERELSQFATKDPKLKGDWDSKYPRTPEGGLEGAAGEVEEYSTALPIEHNLELSLQDVSLALQKIEKGTYGKCEDCGMDISKERLQALPEARFCKECTKRDSKEGTDLLRP